MLELAFRSLAQLNLADPKVNPTARFDSINTLLGIIVPTVTVIAAVMFGAMLMFAGIKIATAGGEPEKIQSAQQTATYAVMGILIIVLSYLVVRLLGYIFQIEISI
ncbi:hypothetical protein KBD81_02605 [Candidatus Woesebacteria bacterium]|nr:hypothetical protein [Candidatus Woesebacteria bacterium]